MSAYSCLARGFIRIARQPRNMYWGGKFFKTLIAASAVGESERAQRKKDYSRAFSILKEIEKYEVDDIWVGEAQWQLGVLYFYGHGVGRSESKAVELFEKAARAGCPDAVAYMKRRAAYLRRGSAKNSLQPTGFSGG